MQIQIDQAKIEQERARSFRHGGILDIDGIETNIDDTVEIASTNFPKSRKTKAPVKKGALVTV